MYGSITNSQRDQLSRASIGLPLLLRGGTETMRGPNGQTDLNWRMKHPFKRQLKDFHVPFRSKQQWSYM